MGESGANGRFIEKARRNRTPGRMVRIDLNNGHVAYGRCLLGVEVEFYDRLFTIDSPVDLLDLADSPVAFTVWVVDRAFSRKGPWSLLDVVTLADHERTGIARYAHQAVGGYITIQWKDRATGYGGRTAATIEECQGLESAAVWDPEHIEDRLRDHFAGVPNRWAESVRIGRWSPQ